MAKSRAACRPARNGALIRPGKKLRPVSARLLGRGELGEGRGHRSGAGSGCSRGRRRTGWTPAAGGRRGRPPPAARRGRPARAAGCWGSDDISPTIIRVKKIPMESTWAEFWKVVFMPEPAPRCCGGQAVHHPGPVRRAEGGHGQPGEEEQDGEDPVGEVDRQELEQAEADGGAEHAAGGEGAGAEAVRQDARERTGDQEPEVSGSMAMPAHSGVRPKS